MSASSRVSGACELPDSATILSSSLIAVVLCLIRERGRVRGTLFLSPRRAFRDAHYHAIYHQSFVSDALPGNIVGRRPSGRAPAPRLGNWWW